MKKLLTIAAITVLSSTVAVTTPVVAQDADRDDRVTVDDDDDGFDPGLLGLLGLLGLAGLRRRPDVVHHVDPNRDPRTGAPR